ncbi:hypothetical protein OIU79_022065 [Salix purpurea]|uniref:Protein arginine N-methyltransferase domain-containing protein n=1 Tax=Salix purpurea TaxID=77065 RepID=A0A9Q1ACH8_SALPP|nr:hypothetical protein OIU79_022065 [Salix purpurea]
MLISYKYCLQLYMAPVTHPDRYGESIDFWQNFYGINMSAMLPLAKQFANEEPSVESISGENILTWPHVRACLHKHCPSVELASQASPIITQASVMPTAPSSNPPMDGSKRKKRTNRNEAHVLSTAPEDPPCIVPSCPRD